MLCSFFFSHLIIYPKGRCSSLCWNINMLWGQAPQPIPSSSVSDPAPWWRQHSCSRFQLKKKGKFYVHFLHLSFGFLVFLWVIVSWVTAESWVLKKGFESVMCPLFLMCWGKGVFASGSLHWKEDVETAIEKKKKEVSLGFYIWADRKSDFQKLSWSNLANSSFFCSRF